MAAATAVFRDSIFFVVGIERVVFGTDYPCPMEIVDAVNWINGLKSLTENEKKDILSKNPAQMLSM